MLKQNKSDGGQQILYNISYIWNLKKKKKGNNNKIASSWVQRIYWPLQEEGSGTVGEMLFLLMFKEIKSFISLGIKKKKSSLLPAKKKRKRNSLTSHGKRKNLEN